MDDVLHLHDNDNDFHKGAFEEDNPHEKSQTSLRGQLPHRDPDPMLKDADTDFPEPGENPEHSGEENAPQGTGQDPGQRQKQDQNDSGTDDLAA